MVLRRVLLLSVLLVGLFLLSVSAVAAQVFPTPDITPVDPMDAMNAGAYGIQVLGLDPAIVVFLGLAVAGGLWALVARRRGR